MIRQTKVLPVESLLIGCSTVNQSNVFIYKTLSGFQAYFWPFSRLSNISISSTVETLSSKLIFSLIWSGLVLLGITLYPFCKAQVNRICDELWPLDLLRVCTIGSVKSGFWSSFTVVPRELKKNYLS